MPIEDHRTTLTLVIPSTSTVLPSISPGDCLLSGSGLSIPSMASPSSPGHSAHDSLLPRHEEENGDPVVQPLLKPSMTTQRSRPPLRWCSSCAIQLLLLAAALLVGFVLRDGYPVMQAALREAALPFPSLPPSLFSAPTCDIPSSLSLNLHRLALFFDKLESGLPVTLSLVGGSNAFGHGLSDPALSAFSHVLRWIDSRWPVNRSLSSLNHTIRNHATPATSSEFGGWCLDDIIPHMEESDLVFVEYSVNDPDRLASWGWAVGEDDDLHSIEANMERLTRNVLSTTPSTALFFTYFSRFRHSQSEELVNAEEQHEVVARHYSIPSISLRALVGHLLHSDMWSVLVNSALQPVYEWKSPPTNATIFRDKAHASDLGHLIVGELIRLQLETIYQALVSHMTRPFAPLWLQSYQGAGGAAPVLCCSAWPQLLLHHWSLPLNPS